MTNILVTGASGFVGKNLVTELSRLGTYTIFTYDIENTEEELDAFLASADIVFHLAGVNRPQSVDEFKSGNAELTTRICHTLLALKKNTKIVLSSSIQATQDNPYGVSKKLAEDAVLHYGAESGADAVVYRLKNVFGKWCRPNYNSAMATFCYNISHELPITITNPANLVQLVYIDDVVASFIAEITATPIPGGRYAEIATSYQLSLAEMVSILTSFRQMRDTLALPDFSQPLTRKLYATYLSYLDTDNFSHQLKINTDPRGSLAEFIKSPHIGQIFVSRTHPGITRGNHWHHTKAEKFMVVEGQGIIRFRQIHSDTVIEYPVDGELFQVVDIIPGYTL